MNRVGRIIQFLDALIERITRYAWLIAGSAITLMAFVIAYNVVRRYAFREQDQYAFVTTSILMLVCVFFAIAYTQRQGQHLRVDLLDKYLPETVRGILQNIIGPILALICISILVWKSWDSAWFSLQIGDVGGGTVRIVTWPSRMAVPIGGGMLCLVLLAQMVRYLASFRSKT